MKIATLTYGSRGDVQPFLALADGLIRAGHEVRLAGPHRFSALAATRQIPFAPLAGDPVEISKALNSAGSNPFRMVKAMQDYVMGIAPEVIRQVLDASYGAELLIHSFLFTTGGHSLAYQLGIPDVSIQTFPMFAPTGDYPNVAFPPLGWAGNIFSHWLSTFIFRYGGNNAFRQIQHLLPAGMPRKMRWPFDGPNPSHLLIACSPSVIPPSTGWPPYISMSGYLFMDDESYQPPDPLARFLKIGPPPVCVTFGSMVNLQAERIQAQVLEGLTRRNERVIFLAGWNTFFAQTASENVLVMDTVPHDWLFKRCKAVIHHGGAGTTAAGLRAGLPAIILPHAVDQPFWGRRVQALGVGVSLKSLSKLSPERIRTALEKIDQPDIAKKASALAEKLRLEDGLGQAIRLIEQAKSVYPSKHRRVFLSSL